MAITFYTELADALFAVHDHAGRVFNQPGLYVFDGSIIPRAIDLNPSKTIAALAACGVELLLKELENSR